MCKTRQWVKGIGDGGGGGIRAGDGCSGGGRDIWNGITLNHIEQPFGFLIISSTNDEYHCIHGQQLYN